MKKFILPSLVLFVASVFAPVLASAQDAPTGNAARLDRQVEEPEKPYRHQLFQNDIALDPSENYVVTFWAKASAPTRLAVSTKNSIQPWAFFGLRENIEIGTEWQRYQLPFNAAKAIPGHSRLTFNYGDTQAVKIMIADVAIQLAGRDRPKDNLVVSPRFEKGLSPWQTDGRQPGVFSVDVLSVAAINAEAAAK
jgi:hypothetical protein